MMDCGPAALKAMLAGWGLSVSYGRLREACQTNVDGTSIDTLEEVGAQLGLVTEQIMVPVDHLLLGSANALPAIVVVRHASGVTHFIVVWRQHGRFVQLMDPAIGRRWVSRRRFLKELYVHTLAVPAADWREWAGSAEFLGPLNQRLANLEVPHRPRSRILNTALADASWRSLAVLDAATRLLRAIMLSGAVTSRVHAVRILETFCDNACDGDSEKALAIPEAYWSVRPLASDSGEEQLSLRGAVLVRVKNARRRDTQTNIDSDKGVDASAALSPELAAALAEGPVRPLRELFRRFWTGDLIAPSSLVLALGLAGAGVIVEALLLRGLLDIGREFVVPRQRLVAFSFLLLIFFVLVFLDLPIAAMAMNIGRRLEVGLRVAFLEKLSRLSDRYFHSRLTSDLAERSQSIYRVRLLPELGSQLMRSSATLLLTTAAIVWLSPPSTSLVILSVALAFAIPLIGHPLLSERDLRVRTHAGALSRFYLDALMGLIPIRTHCAEPAIRQEHEGLLVEWMRASRTQQNAVVAIEGLQLITGFGLAALLSYSYLTNATQIGGAILLVYWALSLPVLGQEIAMVARLYPTYRNTTLRLLEPLGAIDEETRDWHSNKVEFIATNESAVPRGGVDISLREVAVVAGGHRILEGISLDVACGSHVAIVGVSGAGKSSLAGLLLGWHRPASGQVLVNGFPLEGSRLEELRRHTAWVDPSVQLWNRSLIDNLRYGNQDDLMASISKVIERTQLDELLQRLSEGLQTNLGEGGTLVSGGEGQRVRLGRAMLRPKIKLVILDEPFRGLDREGRSRLLAASRQQWCDATLLCVTHDIAATLSFERVIVIEAGKIIEDGSPRELSRDPASTYRGLLEARKEVRTTLWSSGAWRRLQLDKGELREMEHA